MFLFLLDRERLVLDQLLPRPGPPKRAHTAAATGLEALAAELERLGEDVVFTLVSGGPRMVCRFGTHKQEKKMHLRSV